MYKYIIQVPIQIFKHLIKHISFLNFQMYYIENTVTEPITQPC